jgi:hypothetical protein
MKLKHPYVEFEGTRLWKLIDKILNDLIENNDIETSNKKWK